MIDSTEWDNGGSTAVRKRPVAPIEIEDFSHLVEAEPDDGVEAEWYAAVEESFDTAPVVIEQQGIKQRTFLAFMLMSATLTATVVCLVFKLGGHAVAAPAAVVAPMARASSVSVPNSPTPAPVAAAPAPAPPIAVHRSKPKSAHASKPAKRHRLSGSSEWATGFAQ